MRWFKHMCASQNDEILSELMDEFGAEGYGVWWLVLEKIAHLMDETDRTFARFSVKVWANSARISVKKFQNIVKFLEKKERFYLKMDGQFLTITCPNLLKYRDEWTERQSKRVQKTLDILPSDSGETPSLARAHSDPDTDPEVIIQLPDGNCIRGTKPPDDDCFIENETEPESEKISSEKISNCPHEKIIELYHRILPTMTRVEKLSRRRKSELRARWREHPDLQFWENYFTDVSQMDFLLGAGNRGWQADFEWLIKKSKFEDVLKGKYKKVFQNRGSPVEKDLSKAEKTQQSMLSSLIKLELDE